MNVQFWQFVEVSEYNVYITNQFQTILVGGWGGGGGGGKNRF